MIDFSAHLVELLSTILPTYYDLFVTNEEVPCITYQPLENVEIARDFAKSKTYSRQTYQIKVWADDVSDIVKYSSQIDSILKPYNFVRTNTYDMTYNGRICKVITYEGKSLEILTPSISATMTQWSTTEDTSESDQSNTNQGV